MIAVDTVEAMAQAKANAARRKFGLSLQDLCIRVVANSEDLIGKDKNQQRLLGLQASTVKTRILLELSQSAFQTYVHPASKYRVVLVKILVHSSLEKFNFAVCGNKLGKTVTEMVWKTLAEKAGQSLRCVHDLRVTAHTLKSRTLAWCLPFVAKMPKLQQLRLTTLCVTSRDQLVQLLEAAPQLKCLQVHLHKACVDYYSLAVRDRGMVHLDEMILSHNQIPLGPWPNCETQLNHVTVPLSRMPHLKANCVWADRLGVQPNWIWHSATSAESSQLEHLCVSEDFYSDFLPEQLTNVKHLLLSESASGRSRANCGPFNQLQTLHIRWYCFPRYVIPKMQLFGTSITFLLLDTYDSFSNMAARVVDAFVVLNCCKNLTDLVIRGGRLTVTSKALENLPLKRLVLIRVSMVEELDLPWLLGAIRLEQLTLTFVRSDFHLDWQLMIEQVVMGLGLVNLRSFHLSASRAWSYEYDYENVIIDFATSVLAYCPNLSGARVNLEFESQRAAGVKHLVDLLNA